MKSYILLTIFPAVSAIIDLQISGFHTNISIQTSGIDKAIITDPERISFNLTDGVLKSCIKEYIGAKPDDVFLHSPTPWDLFKKYSWTETYRLLQPVSSRVVNVATSLQMLKQDIIRNETKTGLWMTESVYCRFSSIWMNAPVLSVKKINYIVNVDSFKMEYISAVGVNRDKLKAVKIGESINVSESVVQFFATKVSVKAEIVYQASLWGNVVLNFYKSYGGHHFYSPSLDGIMANCGLNNRLKFKELVEINYYTDAKIVVKNLTDGSIVLTRNVEIYPVNREIMIIH